ncbi:hypothetical protein Cgig2_016050 [Carnegiea gigantea]|uniref:CCHC-type domain-containing protein n=1 Tax=Carnegiea gigantea TaxID=171969 RepID=A0A9Q1GFW3_9CARY|nr:hypothetical protein Cgig2_016050 [Carnegiea gigantea]
MPAEGAWAFDGHILLLKEFDIHKQPSKIEFTTTLLVKIYELLMSICNLKCAELMVNKIGIFVEADQTDILVPSKALKSKVDSDLKKPLRCGLMLKMNGTPSWFKMRSVKLSDFCYACGLLGHDYRYCQHHDAGVPESCLQYGPWVRASPMKKTPKSMKG